MERAGSYCEYMSTSDPGNTRRGNTMPGRDFLRVLVETTDDDWDDWDVVDVEKCQHDSVDADAAAVWLCGDRMVRRRSHDGKASDRCDGTEVRVDANRPRRLSAHSAATTSSRQLSSDLRSSAAMMKLVRWCVCCCC